MTIASTITLARLVRILNRVHPANECGPDCFCLELIKELQEEVMGKLVETPVQDVKQKPSTQPSGSGKTNGEPGLPQRSSSSQSVNEVTYDTCGGLKPGVQK
jgi:hypothetical protein